LSVIQSDRNLRCPRCGAAPVIRSEPPSTRVSAAQPRQDQRLGWMERYYSGRQPAIIITTQRDESQRPTEIGSFHTVVLLGAGASFGSDDPKLTPPLGKALFDALVATT